MSLRFLAASTRYLTAATPVVSGTPLSMAAWVNPDNVTGDFGVVSVGIEGDAFSFHCLELFGSTAGDPVRAASRGTSGAVVAATTSSGFSAGAWQHVAGVWSAANARAAYLNGGSKGTNTSSVTPGTFDVTKIGIRPNSVTIPMSGLIANAAVWNVALTDAEILMLALGALPFNIRPANLVAYWPIVGNNSPERNIGKTSGLDMTWTNSPTKDVHAPVRTHPKIYLLPGVAAGGTTQVTKDVSVRWHVRDEVSKDVQTLWNVRDEVSKDVQTLWNVRDEVFKDVQTLWNVRDEVFKDVTLRWNVLESAILDVAIRWHVRQQIAKDAGVAWNVNAQVSKDVQILWNTLARVTKDASLQWHVLASVLKDVGILWDTESALLTVQKDVPISWNVRQQVQKDATLRWMVLQAVQKDATIAWNVLQQVLKDADVRWNVLEQVLKDAGIEWDVLGSVTKDVPIRWNTLSDLITLVTWEGLGVRFEDTETHLNLEDTRTWFKDQIQ